MFFRGIGEVQSPDITLRDNALEMDTLNTLKVDTADVNPYEYPKVFYDTPLEEAEITIGDLHGNVMNWLHILTAYRVIDIDQKTYEEIAKLYMHYDKLPKFLDASLYIKEAMAACDQVIDQEDELNEIVRDADLAHLLEKYVVALPNYSPYKHYTSKMIRDHFKMLSDSIEKDMKTNFSRSTLQQYKTLLSKIKVNSKPPLNRLLGDEICDRGVCDYFTFLLFKFIDEQQIPATILESNHGILLIECYERNIPFIDNYHMSPVYTKSMRTLNWLIENKLVEREEINQIIEKTYLPKLKLLDATIVDDQIVIYSHAHIGIDTIEYYAKFLHVEFKANTPKDLKATIDNINNAFQEQYVKTKTIHQSYKFDLAKRDELNRLIFDPREDPIGFGLWNRDPTIVDRSSDKLPYKIIYVHGHDSTVLESEKGRVINLNSLVGKGNDFTQSEKRTVLVTNPPLKKDLKSEVLPDYSPALSSLNS